MHRPEWTDPADPVSPLPDPLDALLSTPPAPAQVAPAAAEEGPIAEADDTDAEPRPRERDPHELSKLVASRRRKAVRVVGAPPAPEQVRPPAELALRSLPVAMVNRRRAGWAIGVLVSVWIVAVFARQVGDASAAASRADQVRVGNAALAQQVAALQHEREVVQDRAFIEFQARGYGLGNAQDQRFTLAQNAPPLASNAPGSASVRLAPEPTPVSPLDSWLSLLFGPSR
jgi:hypothetical protein